MNFNLKIGVPIQWLTWFTPRISTNSISELLHKAFPRSKSLQSSHEVLPQGCNESVKDFTHLRIESGNIGSHSVRKGYCCFASSGSEVTPYIVSFCLHAMKSMGTVKEQYYHYEEACNRYLGCIISGMNSNSYLFAALPSNLDFEGWRIS